MTSFLVRIIFVALCVTTRVFSLENRNNGIFKNDEDFKVFVQAEDHKEDDDTSVQIQTASGFDEYEKTSKVMNLTIPDRVYAGPCATNPDGSGGTGGGILQSLSFYNCYYTENCTLGLDRNYYNATMIFRPSRNETRMFMNVTAHSPSLANENQTITSAVQVGGSAFYNTTLYSFRFNVQFPTANFDGKNGTYGLQIEFYNPSSDPALVICRTFDFQLNTGQIHGSKLGDECFKEGLECYFTNSVCTGNAMYQNYQTCACKAKSFLDGKECKTQAGQTCTNNYECIENAECTKPTSGASSKTCNCKNGYSSPDNDVNYCSSANAAVLSVFLLVALQLVLFFQKN